MSNHNVCLVYGQNLKFTSYFVNSISALPDLKIDLRVKWVNTGERCLIIWWSCFGLVTAQNMTVYLRIHLPFSLEVADRLIFTYSLVRRPLDWELYKQRTIFGWDGSIHSKCAILRTTSVNWTNIFFNCQKIFSCISF